MITVPEAARRAGRNPETIRRWIREGKLRARKIGTHYVLEEEDLAAALASFEQTIELPPEWRTTFWGGPMPDFVSIMRDPLDRHQIDSRRRPARGVHPTDRSGRLTSL
jgi:excisionase family DNA binding protein